MRDMIVDGKGLADGILKRLRGASRRRLQLAAISVGNDKASAHFLRQKEKACLKAGVGFMLRALPAGVSRVLLEAEVKKLVRAPSVTGIIVQLPLPKRLGEPARIFDLLPEEKDPDVLGREAFGHFCLGRGILPPVVAAIQYILKKYRVGLKGKNVVVVGAGRLVGKPAAIWFMNQGATVTVLNEWTRNLPSFMRRADIVVSGVGKPGIIRAPMIKKGALIFDAGYDVRGGRISGDAAFASVAKKAKLITPVPGGLGPLGVAMLINNLFMIRKKDD